jgi:dTDP-3,4-didehydro-2,6-dideoxy-alpha-D-glucose 3-reductase
VVSGTSAPLRLGVLGCAQIAYRRIAPAILAEDSIRLVAAASRSLEKAAHFADQFGCEPVHGYQELLDRTDIDAVYTPVPAAMHAHWVERALRAGKHVLAEKPLAADPADAQALMALAARSRLVLMENALFPHHAQHESIRGLIASGVIGTLYEFSATFTIPRRPASDIRHVPELGGGALYDVGFYPLRAAQLFLGSDLRMLGVCATVDTGIGVDTAGTALLSTSDGVAVRLTYGIDHSYEASYSFRGSTGTATLHRAFTPPADLVPELVVRRGPGDTQRIPTCADDQVGNALRRFAQRALHGMSSDPNHEHVVRHAVLLHQLKCGHPGHADQLGHAHRAHLQRDTIGVGEAQRHAIVVRHLGVGNTPLPDGPVGMGGARRRA